MWNQDNIIDEGLPEHGLKFIEWGRVREHGGHGGGGIANLFHTLAAHRLQGVRRNFQVL